MEHTGHGSSYVDSSPSLWSGGCRIREVNGGTSLLHDAADVNAAMTNDEEMMLSSNFE